jgi:hypothetical protein
VPLVYLQYNMVLLEAPSRASLERARALEQAKLAPAAAEVRAAKRKAGDDTEDGGTPAGPIHRHKRAKGPNPLAVRKPQHPRPAPVPKPAPHPAAVAVAPDAEDAAPEATPTPQKRRRRGTRAGAQHRREPDRVAVT